MLAAVLPSLGIILYTGLEARSHALRDSEKSTMLLAKSMGEIQERATKSIQQLFLVLSRTQLVLDVQEGATEELLRNVASTTPVLENLLVTDREGNVLAAALPHKGFSIAEREYFQKTIRDNTFTVGEYIVSKVRRVPVFPFAYPLRDAAGNVKGALVSAIRLDALADLFQLADFPPGSVLSLADRKGNRVCRIPREEGIVMGRPLPEPLWAAMTSPDNPGFTIQTGGNGIRRIFAFAKLRLKPEDPPYLYIIVGIPEEHGLAVANALLKRNLALLAAAALLALSIAWILGKLMLARPMDRLVEVTEKIGAGHFAIRTGRRSTLDELGRLERSVDNMADTLAKNAEARRQSKRALQEAYDFLEQRVENRTSELRQANDQLRTEIEERTRVQEALRLSEAIHRALYEQSPAGILVMDILGVIQGANPAALNLLGYTLEELRGRKYESIIQEENLAALPRQTDRLRTGETVILERVLMTKDGRAIPVDINGRLVDEHLFQAIFTDTTQRKKLEQLRQDIERITHHDLKTPLVAMVQLPALMLRNGRNLTPNQRELLQMIQQASHRMLRTLTMSLALYKMETGAYECDSVPFDLLKTVRALLEETRHSLESQGLTLTVLLDGAEPDSAASFPVEGEEHLCFTILENLLKNALEASPERETITVSLDSRQRTLAIRNKGEVPRDIRDTFFEKYVTSGKKWGTGLGTYSAWLIARAQGWDIRLDTSVPGETKVEIRFPEMTEGR